MKVVLSNKMYLKPDEELKERLEKGLTYQVFDAHTKKQIPRIIRHFGPVARGTYWAPVCRTDLLQGYDIEYIDKRVYWHEDWPEPTFTLREDQKEIYEAVEDSCLINGRPGFGKTILLLAIAYKLKQKTLVVCTTTAIRDMWRAEIRKWFDIEPGIIGSGEFDHDSIITVGNIQTIQKHGLALSDQFGLLAIDECFDYETMITLADGTKRKIGAIVNKKETPLVRSYSIEKGKWENKRVLRHFKNKQDTFLKITCDNKSSIKCTENHKLYTLEEGKIVERLAKDCAPGTELVSDVRHKDRYKVKNWGLLIALALGDGNLDKTKGGVRLRITHGEAQRDYLECKAYYLGDKASLVEGKSGYCDNKVYMYQTPTFSDEIGLYDMLYGTSTHKSSLPAELMEYVDWRTLAYLIMDDGSYNGSNITLSLCEMDIESLYRLGDKFFSREEFTVYTCNKGYNYIRIKQAGVSKVIKNCLRHFHPDMRYKLGLDDSTDDYNPDSGQILENFTTVKVQSIEEVKATGGYRYNFEVEDNHNYIANGKLVSNCHHTPASTFTKVLFESRARYKIGLSGTLKRKDGLQSLFKDFFGFDVHIPPVSNTMEPSVHLYDVDVEISGNQMVPWALKVNDILANPRYRKELLAMANCYIAMGHKVLLVSDRVEFLKYIDENVKGKSFLYIGEASLEDRNQAQVDMTDGKYDIFCASQNIFSEGISQNNLSCLILGSPIGNNESLIEQLVGRVQRECDGKLNPIVVDIGLGGYTGKRHRKDRISIYAQNGWKCEKMNLGKLINKDRNSFAKLLKFKV